MSEPKIYKWPLQVQHQPAVTTNVRVRTVSLGDGYEQVAEDGINTRRSSYSLQHIGPVAEIAEISNFLLDGVTTAFYFTPPHGTKGLYRVGADSIARTPISGKVARIDATLTQVFGVGMRMA